jgi:putative ATP-binding cassette transporter
VDAIEGVPKLAGSTIEVHEDASRVAYERLTLLGSVGDHVLVRELSISVPRGIRVLVVRAERRRQAGAAPRHRRPVGERTRTDRPAGARRHPVSPRAAVPSPGDAPGSPRAERTTGCRRRGIGSLLRGLALDDALERTGGLDVERDWDDTLSLGEQQLLSVARVVLAAPRFVFLERPRAALGSEQVERILRLFSERSITYLTLGNGADALDDYDAVLEIAGDGGWTWTSVEAGRAGVAKTAEGS